jgi:GTP-binding protein
MSFTVAIVGRPNVGKSTLFNRLVGRRIAIVDPTPGVTRDRREGRAELGGVRFTVIDTPGLEEAEERSLAGRMRAQTEAAIIAADAVLFVIDAREGVTPLDRHYAQWLRRGGVTPIIVANKCEGRGGVAGYGEAHALGFGEPIAVSAEHGEGFVDLAEAILQAMPAAERERDSEAADEPEITSLPPEQRPIRLAIVGRPNVGKSTLVNALLGDERMLTGPEPGITRDAIELPWSWKGRPLRLVDTAGLRRKARIEDTIERMSAAETLRIVRESQVVMLVIDAATMLEKQDLQIAGVAIEEGRALVIAVNKWDAVEDANPVLRKLHDRLELSLPEVAGLRVTMISALHRRRLDALMRSVFDAFETWNRDLPTPKLNRWLEDATSAHAPPIVAGLRPRLRFCRQVARRPPTIAIFGNRLSTLPGDYQRYLANTLRKTFDLPGTPIRFDLRQSENPYAGSRRPRDDESKSGRSKRERGVKRR